MDRNRRRSSTGWRMFCASSSTRRLKASQDNSRLMKRPGESAGIAGIRTGAARAVSPACWGASLGEPVGWPPTSRSVGLVMSLTLLPLESKEIFRLCHGEPGAACRLKIAQFHEGRANIAALARLGIDQVHDQALADGALLGQGLVVDAGDEGRDGLRRTLDMH